MITYSEKEALLLLSKQKEVSFIKKFLKELHSAAELADQLKLECNQEIEKELEWMERFNIQILSFKDPSYPQQLFQLPNYPLFLYVRGNTSVLNSTIFAMVGTRHHSIYGGEAALKFSKDLAANGLTIVSGLANGIDTKAHIGTLNEGKTIAVLGSGILNIYPKENRSLADEIINNGGAVISEFPLQTSPQKFHFPMRNRIVAALSCGILLIESPLKGGAMITLEKGRELGKKLFAIPGRIDCETFQGNHHLIKSGIATLVENSEEIISYFGFKKRPEIQNSSIPLNQEENAFFHLLPDEEKNIEQLVLLTQYPIMKLNVLLTRLKIKGRVKEFPGKIYKKVGS